MLIGFNTGQQERTEVGKGYRVLIKLTGSGVGQVVVVDERRESELHTIQGRPVGWGEDLSLHEGRVFTHRCDCVGPVLQAHLSQIA